MRDKIPRTKPRKKSRIGIRKPKPLKIGKSYFLT